ncbi:MAG: DUF2889 domain-containing protein [Proteobacteria bacterium]|nr:DUF2889 domain-containing protein [Pseudomonadota bacterium]HQR03785.1 DUF2889 domain-containing protein [Rhodocyclaceae bacterium]
MNPRYGSGIFRRRIRVEHRDGRVVAGLEDPVHACLVSLTHDGHTITHIEAAWIRNPTRACVGATRQLPSLAGRLLTASRAEYREYDNPRQHCTHLHDLLGLAVAHALRKIPSRQFDVTVPDLKDGSTLAEVSVDGRQILAWHTDLRTVTGPGDLAGGPIFRGFNQWAAQHYSGDTLEAAHVLQMGIFVANSQLFDITAVRAKYPTTPLVQKHMIGACYAYQPENVPAALPTQNTVRDFTHSADDMLAFL